MGEDLNPFEPPRNVVESGPHSKQLTAFDWAIAIILGIFTVVPTFFATCIGLGMSVVAVAAEWILMISTAFSLLFSLACGYVTFKNYLANRKIELDGKTRAIKRRSFRITGDLTGQSKLEAMLFSCAIGMIALMLMLPSFFFLSFKLGEVFRVSYPVRDLLQAASSFVALAGSVAIGSLFWRRVSKRIEA